MSEGRLNEAQLPASMEVLELSETTTPSPVVDVGKLYTKNDEKLYFQDGSGTEHAVKIEGETISFRSYPIGDVGAADLSYLAGFYETPAAHSILTIGGTVTQTYGTVGNMKAAHAFIVAGGAGGVGSVLTVSGTSITDAGVVTPGDSEIIVANAGAAAANVYFETTLKWLGQITFTLTGGAGAFAFNYGFCKYEDFGNRDFTVTDCEGLFLAAANITDFDLKLFHHSDQGWTYSAAAFVPGGTVICSSLTDQGATFDNSSNGEKFAYKRADLSTAVTGAAVEGVVVSIKASVNNAFASGVVHIGVLI